MKIFRTCTDALCQSSLMLAARAIFAYLAISSAIGLSSASGVVGAGSAPNAVQRSLVSGSLRMRVTPNVKVAMLTNYADAYWCDKRSPAGADYFLDKSTEFDLLVSTCARLAA